MRYKELKEDERAGLDNIINDAHFNKKFEVGVGCSKQSLCTTCKFLNFAKSEFKIIHCYCAMFEIFINIEDPILECTAYRHKGEMTLLEMKNMAYLIEDKDKKVGF